MKNEMQFGNKIRQALNAGTLLDASEAERLRAAREQALSVQKPEAVLVPGMAAAGGGGGRFADPSRLALRLVVPLAVLVVGLLAIWDWQQGVRVAEVEEIDALLLTDELPPEAYLYKGFEAWLKKRVATY